MKIEIGKEYRIRPSYKKSYVEKEWFVNNENREERALVETLWRSGTWIVTIKDEDDQALLTDYMERLTGEMQPDEFEENEFVDAYDGCGEGHYLFGFADKEEEADLYELLEEEGVSWFFDNNWDSADVEHYFMFPIHVEEVDPDNKYGI